MNKIILVLLLVSGALFSCKKHSGNIVLDGQGNKDQLKLTLVDSATVLTRTVTEDSVSGAALSFFALGQINDEYVGKYYSAVYSRLELFNPSSGFPTSAKLDSVVLVLPLAAGKNFYGNKNSEQNLSVFQLKNAITSDSIYYFEKEPATFSTSIGNYTGKIYKNVKDTLRNGKGKLYTPPNIKIKLDDNFGNYLLQLPASALSSNDALAGYIKGIAIKPVNNNLAPGEGGMAVLDFPAYSSAIGLEYRPKIMLYYDDTSTYSFVLGAKGNTVNAGITGPYTWEVATQIASTGNFARTFAQGMGGLKTYVQFPHLFNIAQGSNIAVNFAELSMQADLSTVNTSFYAPPRLNIFQKTSASSKRNYLIRDVMDESTISIGVYDSTHNTYKFRITSHLQTLFNYYFADDSKNYNFGLYITIPSDNPVTAGRVVLYNPKLKIYYTKIK